MSSAICFNVDQSKILSSDNGISHRINNYCYTADLATDLRPDSCKTFSRSNKVLSNTKKKTKNSVTTHIVYPVAPQKCNENLALDHVMSENKLSCKTGSR